MSEKKILLLILDGWGYAQSWGGNAITVAKTPNYDRLIREYPDTLIKASGGDVGLPGHEVGNSEVGHMNLGAGKVVGQDILRINESIRDGTFYKNEIMTKAILEAKSNNTSVHLMGIVSNGGIHSHIVHLLALLKLCHDLGATNVFIHAFTDGRDTGQLTAIEFISKLKLAIDNFKTGRVSTIIGRVFLDRKNDWARTKTAYEALVNGIGREEKEPLAAISNAYRRAEVDEYISPIIIGKDSRIKSGDTVIFFNFRSDRTRQLFSAFLNPNFDKFRRTKLENLNFITFIPYGIEKELGVNVKSAFPAVSIEKTIGRYFEENNLKQFHIAETEKYAHVTFFINGNKNEPYAGEDRVLIPSPEVKSYAEKPEMSAQEVCENLIIRLKRDKYNFYICNFANGDMVGHTGDFSAAVKAVEFLDMKLKEIFEVCVNKQIPAIVTADHGNIEQMVDPLTGGVDNEHTKNPVPCIILSENKKLNLISNGKLGNVTNTCLQLAFHDQDREFLPGLISDNKA